MLALDKDVYRLLILEQKGVGRATFSVVSVGQMTASVGRLLEMLN